MTQIPPKTGVRKPPASFTLHKTLAEHCGAVLLGAKPAALFSLGARERKLPQVKNLLAAHGVTMEALRQRRGRTLLLVYDASLLEAALSHPIAVRALAKIGYPVGQGVPDMLARLRERIEGSETFPHEIGFFLGYPPADVVGFIHHSGQRFKHCCMWKVYSNVEQAKLLCNKYEACRRFCARHIEMGGSLESLSQMVKAG